MEALVLEKPKSLAIRDIEIKESLGPRDVRIGIHTVGVCGSDVHYYTHGRIGHFVVEAPMVLGHEASGTVLEIGREVKHLKTGDRVAMEPGVPNPNSKASRLGLYNLDPAVKFWATPPVHGVLRPEVIHPADYTFPVPDSVSFAEAAMVEPLAVGMHAATKAKIKPGDVALVIGAGPIGMVTALAAIAGGCSRIIMTDVVQPKLEIAKALGPIMTINIAEEPIQPAIQELTDGWGVDLVFECSGNPKVAATIFEPLAPGGTVVWVGMPTANLSLDLVAAETKEARIETVFRYAHVYPRALSLMGSGRINVMPLITETFDFSQSIEAFDFVVTMPPASVKTQIRLK